MNNFLRNQTYQIRISREISFVIWENLLGSRCASDAILFFQKENTQSCPGEISGRDEPVVSGAKDNDVYW